MTYPSEEAITELLALAQAMTDELGRQHQEQVAEMRRSNAGLTTAVSCIVLGPTVWVEVLGNPEAVFPYKYPALFAMIASFSGSILGSLFDASARGQRERAAFSDQYVRSQTGLGAEGASGH